MRGVTCSPERGGLPRVERWLPLSEEETKDEPMEKAGMAIHLDCLEHLDRIADPIELFSPQPGRSPGTRACWVDHHGCLSGLWLVAHLCFSEGGWSAQRKKLYSDYGSG